MKRQSVTSICGGLALVILKKPARTYNLNKIPQRQCPQFAAVLKKSLSDEALAETSTVTAKTPISPVLMDFSPLARRMADLKSKKDPAYIELGLNQMSDSADFLVDEAAKDRRRKDFGDPRCFCGQNGFVELRGRLDDIIGV